MADRGIQSVIQLERASHDASGLVALARFTDAELENLGVSPADAQLMKAWLAKLARGQYRTLIAELNAALESFDVTAKIRINPTSKRLVYVLGNEPRTDRAIIAAVLGRTFNTGEYARIRRCKECKKLFISPAGRGRLRDFCTATHANTHKMRTYRENRKLRGQS